MRKTIVLCATISLAGFAIWIASRSTPRTQPATHVAPVNIIDFEQANSVGWVEHPVNEKDWTPVKRSAWAGVNKLLRTLEPFQYPQDGNLYHPPPPTFSIKVEGKTTTQIVEISEPTGLATVDYRLFRFERREYISEILRLLREGQ